MNATPAIAFDCLACHNPQTIPAGRGRRAGVRCRTSSRRYDDRTLSVTATWLLDVDAHVRVKVIGFRRHGVRATARHWPEATSEQLAHWARRVAAAGVGDVEAV